MHDVAILQRELLPHIFTLTPRQAQSGYFLWHWLFAVAGNLPVRKYGALCCPDFPHPAHGKARQNETIVVIVNLELWAKIRKFFIPLPFDLFKIFNMKKSDCIFILCLILFFLPFFVIPEVYQWYHAFNQAHGMWMSALKFGILSTLGEVIGLRIRKGVYHEKGFGVLPRAMVWAVLGMGINMAIIIFSKGTPIFLQYLGMDNAVAVMTETLSWEKVLVAFSISVAMNTIFAPVFMTLHKITDMHIQQTGGTVRGFFSHCINMGESFQNIDWQRQWGFIFKKTIPLFWFPAHTITFILPEEWRVLFAALLGVVLGVLLSIKPSTSEK